MTDLSKLPLLRRARARVLHQIICEGRLPLVTGIYQWCEQEHALTREDVDRAADDLANAELITLQVHHHKVILCPAGGPREV